MTEKILVGVDLSKSAFFRRFGLAFVVSILLDAIAFPTDARACGAVARKRGPAADPYATLPYLAIEQTLVAWDRTTRIEDFVREARFARTTEPFGFVVPVPGKPEVAKVDSPFSALRREFPYRAPERPRSGGGSKAGGAGGGAKAAPEPLEILSQQRVGSFDVTTLRATAVTALDEWLNTNGFELTESAKPWLAHYVTLHFYFVAFKYAGAAAGAADGMTSETVRIRFETGAPFYPYLEPETPRGSPIPSERMLAVWVVTQEPMIPIVMHTRGAEWTWQTPWEMTQATSVLTANFLAKIPALESGFPIRAKNLWVQPYLDLRTSRMNLGDAVFGYRGSRDLDADDVDALRPLLPVLDARIAPSDADVGTAKRQGCSSVGPGEGTPAGTVLAAAGLGIAIAVARRRRGRGAGVFAVVALGIASSSAVACHGRASVKDEKEKAVVELLSGRPPYTMALSSTARLETKIRVEDVKSEIAGTTPTPVIANSMNRIAECVRTSVPAKIDVKIVTDNRGYLDTFTPTTPLDSATSARLESCWKSALLAQALVTPPGVTKIEVHTTVSQELVD